MENNYIVLPIEGVIKSHYWYSGLSICKKIDLYCKKQHIFKPIGMLYKKIKIGDKLVCVKTSHYFRNKLTVGESYEVKDLKIWTIDELKSKDNDIMMRIAIKYNGPYYTHVEYISEEYFDIKSSVRDKLINEILNYE